MFVLVVLTAFMRSGLSMTNDGLDAGSRRSDGMCDQTRSLRQPLSPQRRFYAGCRRASRPYRRHGSGTDRLSGAGVYLKIDIRFMRKSCSELSVVRTPNYQRRSILQPPPPNNGRKTLNCYKVMVQVASWHYVTLFVIVTLLVTLL